MKAIVVSGNRIVRYASRLHPEDRLSEQEVVEILHPSARRAKATHRRLSKLGFLNLKVRRQRQPRPV